MSKENEKKKMADLVEVPIRTTYNWEVNRPKLYKVLEEYLKMKNENNSLLQELKIYFERLSEEEQEYFLAEIKARVLKKQINK